LKRYAAVLASLLTAALSAPAAATTIYSYTGSNFSFVNNAESSVEFYNSTKRVTGFFEIAEPLEPGGFFVKSFVPVSYAFSDGLHTFSGHPTDPDTIGFRMLVDTQGFPIAWSIVLFNPDLFNFPGVLHSGDAIARVVLSSIDGDTADVARCLEAGPSFCGSLSQRNFASTIGGIGTWTVTQVSEPGTLTLIAVSCVVAMIGMLAWGRRTARI
jgi:hypothetical protein